MARNNRILRALAGVAVAALVTSCSSSAPLTSAPTTAVTAPAPAAAPGDAQAASAFNDTPATVVGGGAPPEYLGDCVSFVQYGAWIGNSLLLAMWNDAGQDAAALRGLCAAVGRDNPAVLEGMAAQWNDIQTLLAVAGGSDAPPPPIVEPVGLPEPSPGSASTLPATGAAPPATAPTPGTTRFTAAECHANYTGCVPVASDVDCAGDGDGPVFIDEPVGVLDDDVFGLDADGDRVACN